MNAEDCTQCDHASLDYPWICPGHPEPVGVELTEGEVVMLRDALIHEAATVPGQCFDRECAGSLPWTVERILATRQAPTVDLGEQELTVALDVETVAEVADAHSWDYDSGACMCGSQEGGADHVARAIVAAFEANQ